MIVFGDDLLRPGKREKREGKSYTEWITDQIEGEGTKGILAWDGRI